MVFYIVIFAIKISDLTPYTSYFNSNFGPFEFRILRISDWSEYDYTFHTSDSSLHISGATL